MYTKQTWASGDTITAAKLNHIEDGIENAPWDAVIRLTHTADSGEDIPANLAPSIVCGTYNHLYEEVEDGGAPCILVEYYHPWRGAFSAPMAYITYVSPTTITIKVVGYSSLDDSFHAYGALEWNNDDTLGWF